MIDRQFSPGVFPCVCKGLVTIVLHSEQQSFFFEDLYSLSSIHPIVGPQRLIGTNVTEILGNSVCLLLNICLWK